MNALIKIGYKVVVLGILLIVLIACQKDTVTPIQSKSSPNKASTSIDRPNEKKEASDPAKQKAPDGQQISRKTVTVSITGLNNKTILAPTKAPCKKGETFIQETLDVVKKNNMQITVKYSGNYVSSIDNLSERQHGPMSGWVAKLNGVKLTKGVGVTTVSPGDRLEWVYSTTGE